MSKIGENLVWEMISLKIRLNFDQMKIEDVVNENDLYTYIHMFIYI